jgi:hypothetical protein
MKYLTLFMHIRYTHFNIVLLDIISTASVLNYVLFVALLSYLFPVDFPLFVYATSFVHYAIYICTFYCRGKDVAFEKFKHGK